MRQRMVAGDVILTGGPEAVRRLMQRSGEEGQGLHELNILTVPLAGGNWTVVQALLPGKSDAEATLGAIRRLMGWARAEKLQVSSEPNSVLGTPQLLVGDPIEWEGDPIEWEGDLAAARVVPVGSSAPEGEARFWQQGAFRQVNLTDGTGQRLPILAAHQGEGVLAGVFDTLPKGQVNQPWLTLHPSATPIVPPGAADLSDHGLMNASLLHAVAPKAQVHLYEVLNQSCYGSCFPLLSALVSFVALAAGRPAVINLSLGALGSGGSSPALQAVLQYATDLGLVVCAAAGNAGKLAVKASSLQGAQVPAAFDNVIAVAACNGSGNRASYSQRGDIAAPGGEDLGAPGPGDSEDMIGMGTSAGSGFVAMDAGTSFAAPLATGAAALVLAQRLAQGNVPGPGTCAEVAAALKAGARPPVSGPESLENTGMGAGILDIPAALGPGR
jgi:hypothetical protein